MDIVWKRKDGNMVRVRVEAAEIDKDENAMHVYLADNPLGVHKLKVQSSLWEDSGLHTMLTSDVFVVSREEVEEFTEGYMPVRKSEGIRA